MPSIDKKYYHNLDIDSNEIKAGRIYNLTTTQRNALSLTTTDKGYLVYDITLLSLFVWNGTAWTSAGGGSQNLQQVTTTGNTTTNNIVLNSTTGEYPNNAIGQNTITDSSISIDYSSATYPFNFTSYLGSGTLQMTASNSTVSASVQTGDGNLYMTYVDTANNINGEITLESGADFNSPYLALTNKVPAIGYLKVTDLTNLITLEFPNKATGTYTIATTADIPTNTSVGFEQNFLLMGA